MRVFNALTAVVSLLLAAASLVLVGVGAMLSLFIFFPLFLLGLVGVLSEVDDRTVRQHEVSMNPRAWREGP